MILQTYPPHLYFASLRSAFLSLASYDEFRWISEHQDYSRLKQRCRQKFLQETVTKTLVVKGSVILTDLTDEIVLRGTSAVCHGSFSDVWKGVWNDPVEKRPQTVSILGCLHTAVVENGMSGRCQVSTPDYGQERAREAAQGTLMESRLSPYLYSRMMFSACKPRYWPGINCAIATSASCLGSSSPLSLWVWCHLGATTEQFRTT